MGLRGGLFAFIMGTCIDKRIHTNVHKHFVKTEMEGMLASEAVSHLIDNTNF